MEENLIEEHLNIKKKKPNGKYCGYVFDEATRTKLETIAKNKNLNMSDTLRYLIEKEVI